MISTTMDEAGAFPKRTVSKRTQSTNPLRTESHRAQRSARTLSVSPPTIPTTTGPRTRPGLGSRTSSAPLTTGGIVDPKFSTTREEDSDGRSYRDSVASIKDDPFFRNYQSPHSVSLARELRSATYEEHSHNDGVFKDPPPRSNKRPSVDHSVNIPVRPPFPLLACPINERAQVTNIRLYSPNQEAGWQT
jgi:hypothetical protein